MFVNFNILNQLGSPAINSNTFANRPAAGQTGRLFVSTDTFEIYRDNGTSWDLIGGPGSSTITGTGTATQVAYFTSSQAIGSSSNLYWDNTNTRLGVGTATPGYTIEANGAVKADRIYLTGATAANGALYWTSDRVTLANYNVGGIVLIETNGGLTAATFNADYTTTFISGIGTRGYTGSPSYGGLFNGSVGINTATPGVELDVHGSGTIQQLNTTGATANNYLAFQRTGTTTFSIGDTYNGGSNYFRIFGNSLSADIVKIFAATGESFFTSTETYSTNNSVAISAQNNLTLPNGTTVGVATLAGVNSSLNLTIQGNATIQNTGRQGLEGSSTISFSSAGTLTVNQGASTVRAFSALGSVYAFNGSAVGTITHLAGLRICFPDNVGSAVNITNNYALLINNQTTGTGTVTYTNRWGIYQEGASDLNYLAANLLIGSTTNSGEALQVTGTAKVTSTLTANSLVKSGGTAAQILAADGSVITAGTNITIAAGTISASGGITGSGAAGQVTYWSSASAVTGNNNLFWDNTNARLGINTTTPGFQLELFQASSDPYFNFYRTTNGTGIGLGRLSWDGYRATSTRTNYGYITIQTRDTGNTTYAGELVFLLATGGSVNQVGFVNQNGNWGLGTNTIGSRLQVNGGAAIGYSASTAAPTNGLAVAGQSTLNGNVGIGFATQTNIGLYVYQNSATNFSFVAQQDGAGPIAQFSGSGGASRLIISSAGSSTFTPSANTSAIITSGYSLTGANAQSLIDLAGTWNTTGNPTAIKLNITNTASGATAYLMDLQVGAATQFRVTKDGAIRTAAPTTGTANDWKLGTRVAAAVVLDTTQYIQLEVGGTLYKLAIVT